MGRRQPKRHSSECPLISLKPLGPGIHGVLLSAPLFVRILWEWPLGCSVQSTACLVNAQAFSTPPNSWSGFHGDSSHQLLVCCWDEAPRPKRLREERGCLVVQLLSVKRPAPWGGMTRSLMRGRKLAPDIPNHKPQLETRTWKWALTLRMPTKRSFLQPRALPSHNLPEQHY